MRPDIEQLKLTLRRGKGSFVPLIELGVHPDIKARHLGRKILTLQDDVDFWYSAGYDYVKLQPVADFNPAKIGVEDHLTYNEDGTVFRKWATEKSGVIATLADLERYQFPGTNDFDYTRFEEVQPLLPEGMGVIGQYGDIFTMTWEMMGFEAFCLAVFDNPELVERLNQKIGGLVISMFEYFAQSDAVDILWYSDDIAFKSGLFVSPGMLRQYFFPWLRKIGQLARDSNKPLLYHSDGMLWEVLDEIVDCGVDALHPIEPKAMDINKVKQQYGDRLCLLGNVDVDVLARGTKEEIQMIVRDNVEHVGYNGGYCVGSGNSIPEYVKYENYCALLEAAQEFGGERRF